MKFSTLSEVMGRFNGNKGHDELIIPTQFLREPAEQKRGGLGHQKIPFFRCLSTLDRAEARVFPLRFQFRIIFSSTFEHTLMIHITFSPNLSFFLFFLTSSYSSCAIG